MNWLLYIMYIESCSLYQRDWTLIDCEQEEILYEKYKSDFMIFLKKKDYSWTRNSCFYLHIYTCTYQFVYISYLEEGYFYNRDNIKKYIFKFCNLKIKSSIFLKSQSKRGTSDFIIIKPFYISVPTEAVAFLGAVGAFLFVLIIFFMYLNKLLCFHSCGGFPCIDQPPKKKQSSKDKLGMFHSIFIGTKAVAYSY